MITEYDQRQVARMKIQIENFEQQKLGLGPLIDDLEFLLNAMSSVSREWKQAVDDEIFVLEEVYSNALDHGLKQLDSKSIELINESLKKIKNHLSLNTEERKPRSFE